MNAVINGLAVIGAITCVVWLVRGFKAWTAKSQSQPDTDVIPAQATTTANLANDDNEHIPVIAAAVYAMLGSACRIVEIDDGGRSLHWAAEGRWMHQTSHRPH